VASDYMTKKTFYDSVQKESGFTMMGHSGSMYQVRVLIGWMVVLPRRWFG
jgi:hypothetical protein